ncbi:hypothetical protein HK100_005726, partial [Physocladia obscura]
MEMTKNEDNDEVDYGTANNNVGRDNQTLNRWLAIFVDGLWVDKTPMPDSIPHVPEVGLTSAPLESMAFHFAQYCKPYSEDFMLCKNGTQDPEKCLKEGRRVTRCALDLKIDIILNRINKLKANCDEEWKKHWECLDVKNHNLWQCRNQEKAFNDWYYKDDTRDPRGSDTCSLEEEPVPQVKI